MTHQQLKLKVPHNWNWTFQLATYDSKKKKKRIPPPTLVLEIVSNSLCSPHSPVSFLSLPSAEVIRLHQHILLRNIYWRFVMCKPNIIMWYGFCPSVVTLSVVHYCRISIWPGIVGDLRFSIEEEKVYFLEPKVVSSSILRLHALWLGGTLEFALRILCNERDWSCSVCF